MTDRDALYRSILANPEDDVVRWVYADFIREQGEEDRADFIELQIQIAELAEMGVHEGRSCNVTGTCGECNREGEVSRLQVKAREMITSVGLLRWFPELSRFQRSGELFWQDNVEANAFGFGLSASSTLFSLCRGFVSTVITGSSFWFAKQPNDLSLYMPNERGTVFNSQGARIVATHPISRVHVKNLTPIGSPIPGGELYPFSFRSSDVSQEVWDLLYPNRFANLRAASDKLSWVHLNLARREAGLPRLSWDSSNDLKD